MRSSKAPFRVLEDFQAVGSSTEAMKAVTLDEGDKRAFATTALALRYGERSDGHPPAPVTAELLVEARPPEDTGKGLWTSFQRVQ